MRTRSEWFLGDAGCGDEDGEHDDATCECRAKAAAAAILELHDEMDCGNHHLQHHHPVPMGSCKRPVTQLFETTSGFGIPESERERNGGGDSEHFTSNMFGTLPPINAFVASSTTNTSTCCDVANGNDYCESVNNRTQLNGRPRRERAMHSFNHARIEEEEDGNAGGPDCPSSASYMGDDLHCFNLIADTHNAPSFSAPVQTSSPYAVRKELRRRDTHSFDGNNNTVKATDQIDSRTVVERKRLGSLHDGKFDEIMVFSTSTSSPMATDGRASGSGLASKNDGVQNRLHGKHKRSQRSALSKPQLERRRMPYLSMSHEDLSMPITDRHRSYNKSSRSSGSLNRSQKSNDDKLMVLFKILDFIF